MEIKRLLYKVLGVLGQKKYRGIISPSSRLYCFDIIASNGINSIILKYFKNIDSCSRIIANEMKKISIVFKGIPIIVGEKSKKEKLGNGIVYRRFGITVVSPDTLKLWIIEERYPVFYAERGGIYVKIDGRKIKIMRERLGLSLGDLARKVGVSRKAIYSYENQVMGTTPYIAYRLEEVLGTSIIVPLTTVFQRHTSLQMEYNINNSSRIKDPVLLKIGQKLIKEGFNIMEHRRAPFELSAVSFNNKGKEKRIIIKRLKRQYDNKETNLLKKIINIMNNSTTDISLKIIS